MTDIVKYLRDRNGLLVEIANGFHHELRKYSYDVGGSAADTVEDALVDVLDGYAYEGRIAWDYRKGGYHFEEEGR